MVVEDFHVRRDQAMSTIPKLSAEISNALQSGAGPLEVTDQLGTQSYFIVPKDEYRRLVQHEFRQWLQVGLDQEARGELGDWNVDEVLAEAHRRQESGGEAE